MAARAFQTYSEPYTDFGDDADEAPVSAELHSGERICPPGTGARSGAAFRALFLLLVALGGGWALNNRGAVQTWWSGATAALAPVLQPSTPESPDAAVADAQSRTGLPEADPVTQPELPVAQTEVAAAPGASAGTPVEPATTPALTPESDSSSEAPPAPTTELPPVVVNPSDPYQKRAAAVGLHPDLSHALLSRLSSADYRNAGVAIKTALAETPDDAVFSWPSDRKPKQALFEVHFVEGAPRDCRRYVVIVTKDRWSTTAQPMEKCGIAPPRNSAKSASVERAKAKESSPE